MDLEHLDEILIKQISQENHPSIIANKISYFLSIALKKDRLSLYEAYMLNSEQLRFWRMSYTKSAWKGTVRISTCLAILNQKMLAHIFEEQNEINKLREWGLEAHNLNKEIREHYILDEYTQFLNETETPEYLMKLLQIRKSYELINYDAGPHHNEVFPYHFYSPEELLLGNNSSITHKKELDGTVEDLIVQLNLKSMDL